MSAVIRRTAGAYEAEPDALARAGFFQRRADRDGERESLRMEGFGCCWVCCHKPDLTETVKDPGFPCLIAEASVKLECLGQGNFGGREVSG